MEEAHSYLSDPKSVAAVAAKRIVKEGRKYGIGAMIVSQRPAEIDQTILSQCGTFIALRMGNTLDRNHIAAATSDGLRGMVDLLPTLRVGEAIIVGEAVHLPTRTTIHAPPEDRRPNSDDPRLVEIEFAPGESGPGGWDRALEQSKYSDLVLAWRRQDPRSPKTVKAKE
jgi:DNA helicase HerA-like ATPase